MCEYEWPPPRFEYVDIRDYSDFEIISFIKVLTEFMIDRKKMEENFTENIPELPIDMPF